MIIKRTDFNTNNLHATILYILVSVVGYLYIDLKIQSNRSKEDVKEYYERILKIVEEKDQKSQVLYERLIEESSKQKDLLEQRRDLDKSEAEVNKRIEKVANKLEKQLNDN